MYREEGIYETIKVQTERLCHYGLEVTPQADVNAFADGNNIVFTQGMMDFISSNEELAFVL